MGRRDRRKSDSRPPDRSQRVNHLKAKALVQAAQTAWAHNLPYKTIALLSEALRREPTNPDILLNLAAAYGRQRDYAQAEELLDRLLRVAPRKPPLLRLAAQTYALMDRPEQAIACYQRCLDLQPDAKIAGAALLELARLWERQHQLDEAQAAVTRALELNGDDGEALLQRALLDRRQGRLEQADGLLREIADDSRRHESVRSAAAYELGQILDDADRCDEAFAALTTAKKLLSPHAGPALREYREMEAKSDGLLQELGAEHFERWHEACAGEAPYRLAVLTGHPRSGTTLVEQVLDSHDDALSADELNVFTEWIYMPLVRRFPNTTPLLDVIGRVPPAVRSEARAMYFRQMEGALNASLGERMLVEKNPAMTLLLPMFNWAFPETKFLIALRDPRDVILSCFMQRLRLNSISVNWLTLDAAADLYVRTMRTWLAMRQATRCQWLEFRYEDVVADLPRQARRIFDFLGLPWDDKALRYYEHARDKVVRSPTYEDVTKPVYQGAVGKWRRYEPYLAPVTEKLRPFLEEFGYN